MPSLPRVELIPQIDLHLGHRLVIPFPITWRWPLPAAVHAASAEAPDTLHPPSTSASATELWSASCKLMATRTLMPEKCVPRAGKPLVEIA